MSLHPTPLGPVPEDTARAVRAAFPKGNLYVRLRDELGTIYTDADFAALFPTRGQPAEAPWRLALVTVFQVVEGLSDRQAAEAVRARMDWKSALGLELTDPGFDYSVLCEFRARLLAGSAEARLLDGLLERCRARGLVRARGRQRTDSTHVLAAIRALNRLELVGETLRAALNALAVVAPDWVRAQVLSAHPEWVDRYGPRVESARFPQAAPERAAVLAQIGADGVALLTAVSQADAPAWLRDVPAVEIVRQVWLPQFHAPDEATDSSVGSGGAAVPAPPRVRLREGTDLPPSGQRIDSPYDPQARFGRKRQTEWVGYLVQVTESCDPDQPHLLTNVETATATTPDLAVVDQIHEDLAAKALPPGEHLVDSGYVESEAVVRSRERYGVEVLGPMRPDTSWQGQAGQGFDRAHFTVDWAAETVTCPTGQTNVIWSERQDRGRPVIHVRFAAAACQACASRAQCTRTATAPRSLKLQPQAQHEAVQAARAEQTTPEFRARYATRAGVEGTLSQALHELGHARGRVRHAPAGHGFGPIAQQEAHDGVIPTQIAAHLREHRPPPAVAGRAGPSVAGSGTASRVIRTQRSRRMVARWTAASTQPAAARTICGSELAASSRQDQSLEALVTQGTRDLTPTGRIAPVSPRPARPATWSGQHPAPASTI